MTGPMRWRRMPMEEESPEEFGYEKIKANLAESSMRDRTFKELDAKLDELVLLYGDHRGHRGAREILATEARVAADDVLLCAGAAMALCVVHTTLLGPDRHLVVVRPNYATNLETPFAIGCDTTFIDLTFDAGYRIDVDVIARAITPQTRLVSITTPHNPTGVETDEHTLRALVAICEERGCHLLVDQTYQDMTDQAPLPMVAGWSDRCITVGSVSKTYGVPGLRSGWLISTDSSLMTRCLAAKEQIVLTGSMVDEALCFAVLQKRAQWLPGVKEHILGQRAMVQAFMRDEKRLEWVRPTGGVTAFPRVRESVPFDGARFYHTLQHDYGTMVGPGHWFGQPDRCFRLGYGYPTASELSWGLVAISKSLDSVG